MSMMTVKAGETVSKSVKVDDEAMVVTRKQSTKRDKGAPIAYVTTWTFNFREVAMKDILELASRTVNIAMQGKFRKCKESEIDSWDGKEFNVKEWLDSGGRQKLSNEEKVKRVFNDMSEDEKKAMLQELSALISPQAE